MFLTTFTAGILLHNERIKICFDILLIIHEHNSKVLMLHVNVDFAEIEFIVVEHNGTCILACYQEYIKERESIELHVPACKHYVQSNMMGT